MPIIKPEEITSESMYTCTGIITNIVLTTIVTMYQYTTYQMLMFHKKKTNKKYSHALYFDI